MFRKAIAAVRENCPHLRCHRRFKRTRNRWEFLLLESRLPLLTSGIKASLMIVALAQKRNLADDKRRWAEFPSDPPMIPLPVPGAVKIKLHWTCEQYVNAMLLITTTSAKAPSRCLIVMLLFKRLSPKRPCCTAHLPTRPPSMRPHPRTLGTASTFRSPRHRTHCLPHPGWLLSLAGIDSLCSESHLRLHLPGFPAN
jgi:hypothetical protein